MLTCDFLAEQRNTQAHYIRQHMQKHGIEIDLHDRVSEEDAQSALEDFSHNDYIGEDRPQLVHDRTYKPE